MQLFCDTRQYPPSLSETKAQKSFTLCQVQLSHNPPPPPLVSPRLVVVKNEPKWRQNLAILILFLTNGHNISASITWGILVVVWGGVSWFYLLVLIIGDILGHYDNVMAYGHQNNIRNGSAGHQICKT